MKMPYDEQNQRTGGTAPSGPDDVAGYYGETETIQATARPPMRGSDIMLSIGLSLAGWVVLIGLGWGVLRLTGLAS